MDESVPPGGPAESYRIYRWRGPSAFLEAEMLESGMGASAVALQGSYDGWMWRDLASLTLISWDRKSMRVDGLKHPFLRILVRPQGRLARAGHLRVNLSFPPSPPDSPCASGEA